MLCPNCQQENRPGANYCRHCGFHFALTCSRCRTVLVNDSRFCDHCGYALTEQAPASPIPMQNASQSAPRPPATVASAPTRSDLKTLMPADLRSKLDHARASGGMEGERRIVTMLFCDIVGSTAAAEGLDPEEWTAVMNEAFDYMIAPIYAYEGTVGRLMGDAILAFFGAPLAHEDDPQRAILAGLQIVEGFAAYRESVRERSGIDINVRVGINTGLVVVGAVGSDMRMEYTAMGDAINLAARMEQSATPGTICIAEDTYKLVAPLFEVEALGGVAIKGKAEPVEAYRVLRRKTAPGRLRGIAGLDAPLIGRQREKALLEEAVANLGKGIGGIICLTGEAGLGKSRLINEIHTEIGQRSMPIGWHEAASLSYESEQPYGLFQRLIRRMVEADQGDPADVLRAKLAAQLDALEADDQTDALHVLGSLFGLPDESGRPPLSGEAFKARLFNVMAALWRTYATTQPEIVVLDDLHWTDPASVDLLLHLAPLVADVPLLLIAALRPDRESPGWRVTALSDSDLAHHYERMSLKPLDAAEGGELVDSLLRISDLPASLRARIQEKAQGNPFFVEEVVRTLIDRGIVVRDESGDSWHATGDGSDLDIPDNLLTLLTARIDQLADDTRRTVQLAAVVGRSFYYRVLQQIAETITTLDDQLVTLQRRDMIREAARQPELEYIFRHGLTQEAAYSTILREQRRALHQQVGEVIEALYPDQAEELASTLAHHFYEGGDSRRALTYFRRAGDSAYRLYAHAEAIDHYTRALGCAEAADASSEELVHIYTRLGRTYEHANNWERALDIYRQMRDEAETRSDDALKLASLAAECVARGIRSPVHDTQLATETGEAALTLARKLGDRAIEAKVLWGLMVKEFWGGGNAKAGLVYGEESLAIARELDLKDQIGFTLTNLTHVYWGLDRMEDANRANLGAREIWLETGNTPMIADSYSQETWAQYLLGNYEAAVEVTREGMHVAEPIDNYWNMSAMMAARGMNYRELGDYGNGIACIEEVRRIGEAAGVPNYGDVYLYLNIDLYRLSGDLERADQFVDQFYAVRKEVVRMFRLAGTSSAIALRVEQGDLDAAARLGEEMYAEIKPLDQEESFALQFVLMGDCHLKLAQGQVELVRDTMTAFANRIRPIGLLHSLPETLWFQARANLMLGETDTAYDALREARALAKQNNNRRMLWRILTMLADLEDSRGNTAEADARRKQARAVVDFIADHCNDALRQSYLARPDVSALILKT